MRVLRSKAVRKYLKLYKIIFGISPPYLVLLDGNFIFAAMKNKLDVRHRIESLLQEQNIKLFVLRSVLEEMRSASEKTASSVAWASECCEVIDDDASASAHTVLDRLKAVLSRRKYFVATQDRDLRLALNRIPGVPLLYFNKVTLVLESPSRASMEFNNKAESAKMSIGDSEEELLAKVSKLKPAKSTVIAPMESVAPANPVKKERIKKKASAPNPLASAKAKPGSTNFKKKKASKFRKG